MRQLYIPAVLLSLAACAQPASVTTTSAGTVAPDTATAVVALDPIEESAPLVELETVSNDRVGLYVIDASGRPVYALIAATGGGTIDCTGACADQFQPVIGRPRAEVGGAIDPNILGTVLRKDGRRQVTMRGMPLWRYEGDQVSTHTRGHGLPVGNGTARLVWPDGKVVAEF